MIFDKIVMYITPVNVSHNAAVIIISFIIIITGTCASTVSCC